MPDGTALPPALPLGNGCVLDEARRQVLDAAGQPLPLRPRSFAVLQALARRSGRAVPPQELLDAVWGHAAVTPDNVTQCVIEIRRAIGDRYGRLLRTVRDRGYLLEVPPRRPPPRLAVPPFAGPGGAAFAGELAVELRRRCLAQVLDAPPPGTSADWWLAGMLRRDGRRLRVTVRLAAAEDGALLWGERLETEGGAPDRLAAEDALVERIAARVAAALAAGPAALPSG